MIPNTASSPSATGCPDLRPADVHNLELLAQVHPVDWRNPRPSGRYNLVVVGGGTAGLVCAMGAAGLGARVALVERHLLGGDCLNYGCVPSKALIRASRAVHDARRIAEFGGTGAEHSGVEFAAVMERMRRLRAGIAHHDSAHRFSREGIDVFLGNATFLSPEQVEVDGVRLDFARAVVATGARASTLPIPGLEEAGCLTNETVFSLTCLPRRLAVVGAGPIGCELAQAFRRFGSEVTVLAKDPQLLPREDQDAAEILTGQFAREGIELRLGADLLSVVANEHGKQIELDRGNGRETVVADEILMAVGRTPNVEGLGMEAAGVAWDRSGVTVDATLRTTNPRIYAAGDICSAYKFTHAADAMARIAIQNALFHGRKRADRLVIPWSTYTDPEIAHVGLSAADATARAAAVRTFTVDLADVDRAVLDGEQQGFARLHVDARTSRVLGATVVGRHAGELIGEASLLLTEGLGAGSLSRTIHPYPTQAEVWKRLGDAHARTRLKPWIQKVFGAWLRFSRR